ncbi:MAG: hypothetical protein ACYS21_06420 [Planctomycetota bacterium]
MVNGGTGQFAYWGAAENDQLGGTLTMETMGRSGEAATPLILIPGRIDMGTIAGNIHDYKT